MFSTIYTAIGAVFLYTYAWYRVDKTLFLCYSIEERSCGAKEDPIMPREKKDAKVLNIKLSAPIHDRFERFCEESGMSKTVATEKILTQFFDSYFGKPENERMIFKID